MSDEKPFAEVVGDAIYFDRQFGMRDTSEDKSNTAALFNSAVAARERKAAAKALRALAASVRCATGVRDPKPSDPFWRDYFAGLAEMRAAALEGGAP